MKMRARAQAEAEKKLPGKESLWRVEAVRAIEPEKCYEKRLATAKTLLRLCFTLAALAVMASPLRPDPDRSRNPRTPDGKRFQATP